MRSQGLVQFLNCCARSLLAALVQIHHDESSIQLGTPVPGYCLATDHRTASETGGIGPGTRALRAVPLVSRQPHWYALAHQN